MKLVRLCGLLSLLLTGCPTPRGLPCPPPAERGCMVALAQRSETLMTSSCCAGTPPDACTFWTVLGPCAVPLSYQHCGPQWIVATMLGCG